jgi:hypothetical protein
MHHVRVVDDRNRHHNFFGGLHRMARSEDAEGRRGLALASLDAAWSVVLDDPDYKDGGR